MYTLFLRCKRLPDGCDNDASQNSLVLLAGKDSAPIYNASKQHKPFLIPTVHSSLPGHTKTFGAPLFAYGAPYHDPTDHLHPSRTGLPGLKISWSVSVSSGPDAWSRTFSCPVLARGPFCPALACSGPARPS